MQSLISWLTKESWLLAVVDGMFLHGASPSVTATLWMLFWGRESMLVDFHAARNLDANLIANVYRRGNHEILRL